jgi:hypothetical protein
MEAQWQIVNFKKGANESRSRRNGGRELGWGLQAILFS